VAAFCKLNPRITLNSDSYPLLRRPNVETLRHRVRWGIGKRYPPPQPTSGRVSERFKLSNGVRSQVLPLLENKFGAYLALPNTIASM